MQFKENAKPSFDPTSVGATTELANFYESYFYTPSVLQATAGVYVAHALNRDNPVLIEGSDGLIVVDPGESKEAATIVKKAFNDQLNGIFDKPVKAIIYTHHHDCHIHGAKVFAEGSTPDIIAHKNLMECLYTDWFDPDSPEFCGKPKMIERTSNK